MKKGHVTWNAVSSEQSGTTIQFHNYKRSAKNRNLSFNLDKALFYKLIKQNCSYCQKPPSNTQKTKRGFLKYNGIDRWNNNIGYEVGNVVTCCKQCNFIKSSLSGEEFLEYLNNVVRNNTINNGIKLSKLNYYYERAIAAAKNSHDIHTKVGALLINKNTGAVIAEGYNGFIRGASDSQLPTTRPEKYDYIVHAETNLICNSVRHGIKTENCVIFCTLSPCVKCLRMLWQAGISSFYFKDKYKDFEECTGMLDLRADIYEIGDFYKMEIRSK